MKRHPTRRAAFLLGLALATTAAPVLTSPALAGETLPDRPGFGYTIRFATGTAAEALLPVERRPLPDRPGFGYTIDFMPSDPAASLYPPGWAKQRGMTAYSLDRPTGPAG
jgi:hypothetical protein